MPKITTSHITNQVDENGVKKSYKENKVINWGGEPPFVKVYLDAILYLNDLPKGLNGVLLALLKRMSYASDEQLIFVSAGMKDMIAKELGVGVQHVSNAIHQFAKGEVLYRIGTGVYKVNPHLFGRGDWADISAIRMEIVFDNNGKSIMSVIEKKDKSKKELENQVSLPIAQ